MPKAAKSRSVGLPAFVRPQLTRLVETPPKGDGWVHEIKFDGYRIHARIEAGKAKLLTRAGLDWTDRYEVPAESIAKLKVQAAYLDGELCAVGEDGVTSFAAMQAATDSRASTDLVYFAFDLLWIDGEDLRLRPLVDRKKRLEALLKGAPSQVRYSEHLVGNGPEVLRKACALYVEGIVSKRADAPYVPGDRGIWTKAKCVNRQEFIVVGWTDPEGSRRGVGALLLGYYDSNGRLIYAGRVGTGMTQRTLRRHSSRSPSATCRS
jgi:bifunctional non-homologous end joining protein LigD